MGGEEGCLLGGTFIIGRTKTRHSLARVRSQWTHYTAYLGIHGVGGYGRIHTE